MSDPINDPSQIKTTIEAPRAAVRSKKENVLELRVIPQPPEVFDSNDTPVHEFAITENYVLVRRGKINNPGFVVYGPDGKQVKDAIAPFVITGADLTRKLTKGYYHSFTQQGDATFIKMEEWFQKLGLKKSDVDLNALVIRMRNAGATRSDAFDPNILSPDTHFFFRPSHIFVSADKAQICFQIENEIQVFQVLGGSGEILHPRDWKKVYDGELSRVTTTVLQKSPWLRQLELVGNTKELEGLPVQVSCERGMLIVSDTKTQRQIFTDSAAGFTIDPVDKKTIYYLTSRGTFASIQGDKLNLAQTDVSEHQIHIDGNIKEFSLDPRANFLLVVYEKDGIAKLAIVAKDTFEVEQTIDDVKGSLKVNDAGTIYYLDTQNRLRIANTNFTKFEHAGLEKAREKKSRQLAELAERLQKGIVLPEAGVRPIDMRASEDVLEGQLRAQLDNLFKPLIASTKTIDELLDIEARAEALKQESAWKGHEAMFDKVEERIVQRRDILKLEAFEDTIEQFEQNLVEAHDLQEILALDDALGDIFVARQGVRISDSGLKKEIAGKLTSFRARIDELKQSVLGGLEDLLTEQFTQLADEVGEAVTVDELQAYKITPTYRRLEQSIALLDRTSAQKWRTKLKDVFEARRRELDELEAGKKEKERLRHAEVLEELRDLLSEIENAAADIQDTKEFKRWWKDSPQVLRYNMRTLDLRDDVRDSAVRELSELQKSLARSIETRAAVSPVKVRHTGERSYVEFGAEKFEVFHPPEVVWQPKVVPLAEGSAYGSLIFEDNTGRVFRPKIGALPVDLADPETQEAVSLFKRDASKYFEALKRSVPAFNERWAFTPYFQDTVGKLAKLSRLQLEAQSGILILEGEAGVGKNVMIDMFAHFTNRETYTLSCNFQIEKEDIMYAFHYDPKKRGTYTVDAKLIEAIQTPGAIVVLDEINTLPAGVTKMLNPLFDYRRSLNLPDGRVIKAHPSVIIVGAMNPQNYLGVKPLSQEVKSRARFMPVPYPPEKFGGKFSADEAAVLAKNVPELAALKTGEFMKLWDYVVNNEKASGGDAFVNDERKVLCQKLLLIIKTANRIREAYKAFRTNQSSEMIEFVFSIRETVAIAIEMNHVNDVKQAIKDVVLPKIADPAEQMRIATIIDNV